jgi:hypothetical protein
MRRRIALALVAVTGAFAFGVAAVAITGPAHSGNHGVVIQAKPGNPSW